jgi:ubiquinone/menaquinone biosynthesis C-methylase UbiE
VADIGAGDGYFTFLLAEAVGPTGKVYAVEVYEEAVDTLEDKAAERGHTNVVAVLGELDDPLLPEGEIDLVFLCNSYHHIDDRTAYFGRLRRDLEPRGRVAIIDLRVSRLIRLLGHADHWTPRETVQEEMSAAGYRREEELDFLPLQNFLIFSAR